jgi:hypothetical protein
MGYLVAQDCFLLKICCGLKVRGEGKFRVAQKADCKAIKLNIA